VVRGDTFLSTGIATISAASAEVSWDLAMDYQCPAIRLYNQPPPPGKQTEYANILFPASDGFSHDAEPYFLSLFLGLTKAPISPEMPPASKMSEIDCDPKERSNSKK
jgi:hypothetical protein